MNGSRVYSGAGLWVGGEGRECRISGGGTLGWGGCFGEEGLGVPALRLRTPTTPQRLPPSALSPHWFNATAEAAVKRGLPFFPRPARRRDPASACQGQVTALIYTPGPPARTMRAHSSFIYVCTYTRTHTRRQTDTHLYAHTARRQPLRREGGGLGRKGGDCGGQQQQRGGGGWVL